MTHNADKRTPLEDFILSKGISRTPQESPRTARERERNEEAAAKAAVRQQWVAYIATVPDEVAAATVADAQTVRSVRTALGMNESEFGSCIGLQAEQIRRVEAGASLAGYGRASPFEAPIKKFVAAVQQASREQTT